MDTLTHIALGACAGEGMLGKQLGRKALLIGAFANTIPDFDFLASFWLKVDEALLAHRGFTHSFLFAVLISAFMALLFQRWLRPYNILFKIWMLFFAAEIFLHVFIDAFNVYGVGWFEPFSHYRVSFNTIFVADPFYSVWPGIAFLILLVLKKDHIKRRFWVRFGLGISSLYLMYCVFNKVRINSDIKHILQDQHLAYDKYFSTPTPLNNWLWYVAAGNDTGFNVGYYSVFDSKKQIDFHYFPVNDSLLTPVLGDKDLYHLVRFSKGFYTVEKWNDTLVFNDLRFGQMAGWEKPQARFVFHYFLQHKDDNGLVVQRGRFADWDWPAARSLIKRIEGN